MTENVQKYLDKPNAPKSAKSSPDRPLFSKKAELKLKELDKDGGVEFRYTKSLKELKLYISKLQSKKEEFHKELAALNMKEAHQTGEGTSNKNFCPEYIALTSKYLAEYNNEYEKICFDYLHQTRLKLNDEIYWLQFKENPEEFENTKLSYRLKWLQALTTASSGRFKSEFDVSHCLAEKEAIKVGGKLANFNDINCQYHSELNLVVGTITIDCNKMVTNFEMGFL